MSNPLVSVVIPTHNRAHIINRALNSVFAQNYEPLEIIIVDDASSDNTVEILSAINDPRLHVLRHEVNKGGAAARNTGIRAATGDYIAFLDSDDEWLPGKLEKQMARFVVAPPSVGVIYSPFNRVKLSGTLTPSPFFPGPEREGNLLDPLLKRNFVAPPLAIMRKECFAKSGYFDESLRRFHDWEFWLRVAMHYEFWFIDEPLALVYSQEEAISANPKHGLEGLLFILNSFHDAISKNPPVLADYYYRIGKMYQEDQKYTEARRSYSQSLAARFDIKTFFKLAVSTLKVKRTSRR